MKAKQLTCILEPLCLIHTVPLCFTVSFPIFVHQSTSQPFTKPSKQSLARHFERLCFYHSRSLSWSAGLIQILFMMILAMHEQDYHSHSLDSRLDPFKHGQITSSLTTRQQPISAEELWNSYFERDDFVYQGLDLNLIQGRVHESDTRKPSGHSQNPSRAQQKVNLSFGKRSKVGVEGSLARELRQTKLPNSDIPSRHPVSQE